MSKFSKMKKPETKSNKIKVSETKISQVRMFKTDSLEFSHAAAKNDQSIQSALIEAINLYLAKYGASPVGDPGTKPNS